MPRPFYFCEEFPSGLWVSTIDGRDGIKDVGDYPYETCVFPGPDDLDPIERRSYRTPWEAARGHGELVVKYRALEPTV